MTNITIKTEDWIDFTKEIALPVLTLLNKGLHAKLIEWSELHSITNHSNTRLDRFTNDPELAKKQRSYFLTQAIKSAINIAADEGSIGTSSFYYNCETNTGKVDTLINLEIVRLNGIDGDTLLIY